MTVPQRRRQALIVFVDFGIIVPNLFMALLLWNPQPVSWPLPAKIVAIGIAVHALVLALCPALLESED